MVWARRIALVAQRPDARSVASKGWHIGCSLARTHLPKAMRQVLLTASLLFSLGLAGCADHSGAIAPISPPNNPPIGPSDGNNVNPQPGDDLSNALPGGGGGFNGGGSPPGDGGGGGGGGRGGGRKDPGGGGGGPAGSPVPEPGTMLLVGTGLAGAALMRRRRQAAALKTEA